MLLLEFSAFKLRFQPLCSSLGRRAIQGSVVLKFRLFNPWEKSLIAEFMATTMCSAWTRFVGEKLFADGMLAVTMLHNHTLQFITSF
jgi:hypothetical protein